MAGLSLQNRERLIVLSKPMLNTADYLEKPNGRCAGICAKSAQGNEPMLGLMRKCLSAPREDFFCEIPMVIKGLNHRFPQSNEIFPSYPKAALQSERLINVATYCLCQAESVDFIYQPSNYNYLLRPKSPKRLLCSNEIP